MSKKIKKVDVNKLSALFDEIEPCDEVQDIDKDAISVLATIDGYYDCLGSFINNLNEEILFRAEEMLEDVNHDHIINFNRCSNAYQILENIKSNRTVLRDDLF